MNFKGKLALLGLIVASFSIVASAVPAKPGLMTMTNADGSTVEVRLIGDERHHQYFTADGYLLAEQDGNFYYATVDGTGAVLSSGLIARASGNRTAQDRAFLANIDKEATLVALNEALEARSENAPMRNPGLFPESRFPGKGKQKGLVVLVEYTDVKFQVSNPYDYFYRMLNEDNFSDYGGTGSAHQFFYENSMGQFDCDFDVYGPITLSRNQAYYGGNGWSGDDQNPEQMAYEACQQLDATVDFTEYDRDNDGYIDNVFVFYAGRGEASGGGSNTVWPHSWTVSAGMGYSPQFDGVYLDRYACSNEWEGTRPDGVGTFVHEFSHVMGLPDLYATSYTSSFTPGAWSAMDYGPYNNGGCTPPNYGAFERYALEWAEPVVVNSAMNAVLPVITTNVCGIIPSSDPNEYFLLENRQQEGWDAYVPGHGMLIWHVQYNTSVWASNKVNNTPSHQYVDIEEADGTQTESSRAGDAFPGTSHKTSFTGTTNPAMKTWSGVALNYPITDIAENNGIITFKVLGGAPEIEAPVIEITDNTAESFTINWTATDADLYVNIYSLPEAVPTSVHPDAQPLEGYVNRNLGRSGSHVVEGLQPMTSYFVETSLVNGLQQSAVSDAVEAFTGRPTLDRIQLMAFAADDITETSFVAHWEMIEEADDYLVYVNELVYGAPYTEGCDFADGVNLPVGWSTNSPATYASTAYSGAAIPALRLGKAGDYVETPVFDEDVRAVEFWQRGISTSETDRIAVLGLVEGQWISLSEVPIVTVKGGETSRVEVETPGVKAIRLNFVRTGTKGTLAIDDVVIEYGMTYGEEPVEDLQGVSAGNTDSYLVTGLKSETPYLYYVAATDGTLVSRPSNKVTLETKPTTGVGSVESSNISVSAVGRTVQVSGLQPGTVVTAVDIAGRVIFSGHAGAAGTFSGTVGTAGIYLVQADGNVVKLAIH